MAKSQFEKRKEKDSATLVKEVEEKVAELKAKPATEYTQTGFDVYTPDGGRTYKVAELKYNPETGEASVVAVHSITRLVALQYANTKQALSILKKTNSKEL